jgi:hypothetical protein
MCILLPPLTNIKMFGRTMMLSSAAALLSVTGVSARVPVLDKRQYFPANATDLKTITVGVQEIFSRVITDSSHRLLPM